MLRGFSRVSRLLLVLAFSCVSLLAPRAEATLIDDFFDSGPADLSASLTMVPNSGGAIFPGGPSDQFSFVASLDPGIVFVELRYTSLGGLDLTTMSNDRLLVDLLSIVPFAGAIDLIVTAIDSSANAETATLSPILMGSNELFYSAFTNSGAVFSDLNELRFRFESDDVFALTVDEIAAVPEPSTAVLLGAGLLGLALAGRRERA